MFWHSKSPGAGVKLNGALAEAIDQAFGSVTAFKTSFEEAGRKLFGSGWVWLAKSPNGDDLLALSN